MKIIKTLTALILSALIISSTVAASAVSGDPGGAPEEYEIQFVDTLNWGHVYVYGVTDSGFAEVEWPGVEAVNIGSDENGYPLYRAYIPENYVSICFSESADGNRSEAIEPYNLYNTRRYYLKEFDTVEDDFGNPVYKVHITDRRFSETSGSINYCTWSFNEDDGTLTISGSDYLLAGKEYEDVPMDGGVSSGDFSIDFSEGYWTGLESKIKNVVINYGVKSIGKFVFKDHTALESVRIATSVELIDSYAFEGCTSLKSVELPDYVSDLRSYAFKDCSSLESVTAGKYLMFMSKSVFEGCSSLAEINIHKDNKNYYTDNGTVYTNGVLVMHCPASPEKNIVIKDGVTGMRESAFENCNNIETVTFPDSFSVTGAHAFDGCNSLKSVKLAGNVKYLDAAMFMNCKNLESVELPESLGSIMYMAFYGCESLTDLKIPESVDYIGSYAFYGCNSLDLKLPEVVEFIGGRALRGTAYFEDENNWSGGLFYYGNSLIDSRDDLSGDVVIKDGTVRVADSAIPSLNITSVTVPASVEKIGYEAFGLVPPSGTEAPSPIDGFKIYGYSNTAAEQYAWENNIDFVALDSSEATETTSEAPASEPVETTASVTETKRPVETTAPVTETTEPAETTAPVTETKEPGKTTAPATETAQPVTTEPATTQPEPTEPAATEPAAKDIADCTVSGVKNKTYTGKAVKFNYTVKDGGKILLRGTDYTEAYENNKDAGEATLTITGKGKYTGQLIKTFKINKAKNPVVIKAKSVTAKADKKTYITKSKAFKISKKKGALSFKKIKGDDKISIAKNGSITVRKGLKKSKTYSFRVKVTASGTKNYKKAYKTVTLKIKIK